ncbi:TRAP transporter substrate-binding protein [Bacterioplanes sanyensis]|uniref:TRAP transporter substrate-binding protein n=1 Tax=Bacterioplanes sanyensis TaxID=1249553 RepID=A0A222FKR2_9GAMM|nr:TAXI family TRAP transporter solute-binding subunit [Bacterioplanes sanyensis]ASP39114.1 TRAP transporter substrate-binding protein [Bacterioplanes sanyensis]
MTVFKRLLSFALIAFTLPAAANENYAIGTGSQSGTYYPLGGMLAKVWSEHIDGVNARAEVTAASVENVIKVATNKQLAGIAMGNVALKAHKGEDPFPRQMPASVLFALYPNVVQILVPAKSDIQSVQDLVGKRVSLGAPGSGTRVSALAILAILGINEDDVRAQSLNYTATTNALANGQIDAGVIVGSLGVGAITELALSRDIRILSFSPAELKKISSAAPAYMAYDAAAETYNKVPAFTAPAVWNVLVVNPKLDDELAYQMTKTAYENMDKIRQAIGVAQYITPANAHQLQGVPMHPGAQRYLDEIAQAQ